MQGGGEYSTGGKKWFALLEIILFRIGFFQPPFFFFRTHVLHTQLDGTVSQTFWLQNQSCHFPPCQLSHCMNSPCFQLPSSYCHRLGTMLKKQQINVCLMRMLILETIGLLALPTVLNWKEEKTQFRFSVLKVTPQRRGRGENSSNCQSRKDPCSKTKAASQKPVSCWSVKFLI